MEHLLGLDTCDTLELRRERKGKEVPQNSEEYERGRVPVGEVRYTLSRFQASAPRRSSATSDYL